MLPDSGFHRVHAKESLFPQGFAGFREPCAVKGVLAVLMGQPLPHHVHHAEVIAVKLAVIPTGIDQNGSMRPERPVRIKPEGP